MTGAQLAVVGSSKQACLQRLQHRQRQRQLSVCATPAKGLCMGARQCTRLLSCCGHHKCLLGSCPAAAAYRTSHTVLQSQMHASPCFSLYFGCVTPAACLLLCTQYLAGSFQAGQDSLYEKLAAHPDIVHNEVRWRSGTAWD